MVQFSPVKKKAAAILRVRCRKILPVRTCKAYSTSKGQQSVLFSTAATIITIKEKHQQVISQETRSYINVKVARFFSNFELNPRWRSPIELAEERHSDWNFSFLAPQPWCWPVAWNRNTEGISSLNMSLWNWGDNCEKLSLQRHSALCDLHVYRKNGKSGTCQSRLLLQRLLQCQLPLLSPSSTLDHDTCSQLEEKYFHTSQRPSLPRRPARQPPLSPSAPTRHPTDHLKVKEKKMLPFPGSPNPPPALQ